MGLFDRLFGDDHERAAKYEGRESASDRASRKRRENYRSKGIRRAADAGERWEQKDRRRFGGGR
jgi:hypothetical protein